MNFAHYNAVKEINTMGQKLKARICKNRKCKKEFSPRTEWQKFCSIRCRSAVFNRRNVSLVKKVNARLAELEQRFAEQQQAAPQ